MTAEQIAEASLVIAICVPLITMLVQSRQSGRDSFRSEALERIEMLKEQLADCRKSLPFVPVLGGSEDADPEPFLLSEAEIAQRIHDSLNPRGETS